MAHSAEAERSTKQDVVRYATPISEAVLHLVRHGGSSVGLSTDCALLFEMSRSNPSWDRLTPRHAVFPMVGARRLERPHLLWLSQIKSGHTDDAARPALAG